MALAEAEAEVTRAREGLSDEEVVDRVRGGDTALFEILMRRHNQRLYRAARSITRDDAQAEDVMQAAYVQAYTNLGQFAGRAAFGSWLMRIAVNESFARLRDCKRHQEQDDVAELGMDAFPSSKPNPEQAAASAEIQGMLDAAIDSLPDANRAVFVLRMVEGLSTTETSDALGISEANVKVRLHRARAILRQWLEMRVAGQVHQAFAFHAVRCDRVVRNVLEQIATATPARCDQ